MTLRIIQHNGKTYRVHDGARVYVEFDRAYRMGDGVKVQKTRVRVFGPTAVAVLAAIRQADNPSPFRVVIFEEKTYRVHESGEVEVVCTRADQTFRLPVKTKRAERVRAFAAGVPIVDEPLTYRPNAKRIKRRPGRVHWRDVLTDKEKAIVETFEPFIGTGAEVSTWDKMPDAVRNAVNRARTRARRATRGDPTLGRGNRMKPGADHPSAKLDWDKVREIRASAERQADLASRFGVNVATIKAIRQNRAWVVDREKMISFPADRSLASRRAWETRRAKQEAKAS